MASVSRLLKTFLLFKMMLVCPDDFDPLKMEGLTIKNGFKIDKNCKITKVMSLLNKDLTPWT